MTPLSESTDANESMNANLVLTLEEITNLAEQTSYHDTLMNVGGAHCHAVPGPNVAAPAASSPTGQTWCWRRRWGFTRDRLER